MAGKGTGSIGNVRKKFQETHELISTSYHEAGHTIYGLLHCMKIDAVTVFESKKSKRIEGLTFYENYKNLSLITDQSLFDNRLSAEIGLTYAGLAAEKHFFKITSGSDKFPMFLKEKSYYDINEAANLIQKYNLVESGRKRYNYKQKTIKKVSQELEENWDAVTLIAHGLIKKKKLNFLEIQDLLTKKCKDKHFWKEQFKAINYLYDNLALDEKNIKSILSL